MSVRKAHNSGRNHLRNVIDYYQQIGHEKAQSVIDSITSSYAAEGQANPMLQTPGIGTSFPPPMGFPGMPPPPLGFSGAPPGPGLIPPPGGRGMPFPPFPPNGIPPPNMAGGLPFPPPGGIPANFQFPPPGAAGGPGALFNAAGSSVVPGAQSHNSAPGQHQNHSGMNTHVPPPGMGDMRR